MIDNCRYSSSASAGQVWTPVAPSPPVQAARDGLLLPCPFTQKIERVAWDRRFSSDLSSYDSFTVKLQVDNPSAVSFFTLYFGSGEGWYGASFRAWASGSVLLSRSSFVSEGRPSGWNRIDRVRFSVWKGADVDTQVKLSEISAVSNPVVVIRGDSMLPPGHSEADSASAAARRIERILSRFGVKFGSVSGEDVVSGVLAGKKVLVIPYSPQMPDQAAEQIAQFASQGGRILAFYSLHLKLAPVLGVEYVRYLPQEYEGQFAFIRFTGEPVKGAPREVNQRSWNISLVRPSVGTKVLAEWYDAAGKPTSYPAVTEGSGGIYMSHILLDDDPERKALMFLALLGRLWPDVWRQAAQNSVARIGCVLPRLKSYKEAAAQVRIFAKQSGRPLPSKDLQAAERYRRLALLNLRNRRYPEVLAFAKDADSSISLALLRTVPSRRGEFRGVWCHSAFGVEGWDWERSCRVLAENGFTDVLPNMLWGGIAYYKSAVLPVHPSVSEKGDQIEACLRAAHKYGLKVHVWKVNWNLTGAPTEFVRELRAQDRTQVARDGSPVNWLCPSHPENRKLERDSMLEVVRNYPVDGIHFDYIRYPDSRSCFCDGCRERFQQQCGVRVAKWPDDVISGPFAETFSQWRRDQITRLVEEVSREARRIRPGILVSAAVFGNYPACRDSVGQDWLEWVRKGLLDFVCPMDYTPDRDAFEDLVRRQLELVGGQVPVYPGIGASWPEVLLPLQVADQILAARHWGAKGFMIFNYDSNLAQAVLPMLHLGATKDR
ncbi:MAG: glycoside hydrolase family 10 protein [Armatimonadota bacterium]